MRWSLRYTSPSWRSTTSGRREAKRATWLKSRLGEAALIERRSASGRCVLGLHCGDGSHIVRIHEALLRSFHFIQPTGCSLGRASAIDPRDFPQL
jgi:hypothetical protein